MNHLFFRRDGDHGGSTCLFVLPVGLEQRDWTPRDDGMPASLSRWDEWGAWFQWQAGLFANSNFQARSLWQGARMVQRLIVTPRWYRFPFMEADDLQIGNVWTDPSMRGQGLASLAMELAHRQLAGATRRIWYVTREDNPASIALVERCGYRLVGKGQRTSPLGLRPLGQFMIDQPVNSPARY